MSFFVIVPQYSPATLSVPSSALRATVGKRALARHSLGEGEYGMPKPLVRILALILVPCLLADPASAAFLASWPSQSMKAPHSIPSTFLQQAIVPEVVDVTTEILPSKPHVTVLHLIQTHPYAAALRGGSHPQPPVSNTDRSAVSPRFKTPDPNISNGPNRKTLRQANALAQQGDLKQAAVLYGRVLYGSGRPDYIGNGYDLLKNEVAAVRARYRELLASEPNVARPTQGYTYPGRLKLLDQELTRLYSGRDRNQALRIVAFGIGEGGAPTVYEHGRAFYDAGFRQVQVIGVDQEEDYVHKARQNPERTRLPPGLQVRFLQGDARLDQLGLSGIDLVVVANVFNYYGPEEQKALRTLFCQALSPEGILVTAERFIVKKEAYKIKMAAFNKTALQIDRKTLPSPAVQTRFAVVEGG